MYLVLDATNDVEYLNPEPETDEAGPSSTPKPFSATETSRSLPRLIPSSTEDEGPDEDARASGEAVLEGCHRDSSTKYIRRGEGGARTLLPWT